MKLPLVQCEGIVEQYLGDEVLLYNLELKKAYSLNKTLSTVYRYCDGQTTFDEVIIKESFSNELILHAINELKKEGLLKNSDDFQTGFEKLSRRETIKKVGIASIGLMPVLSMIVVPTALQAQSGRLASGSYCSMPAQCISNVCYQSSTPGTPIVMPGTPITIPGFPPSIGNPITYPGPPSIGPMLCQ